MTPPTEQTSPALPRPSGAWSEWDRRVDQFAYGVRLSDLFGIGDVAKITADRERNFHHMTSHLTSARRSRVRALGATFAIVMVLGGT